MATAAGRDNPNGEINRQEIQSAIAKAVELRALHAAIMQGNSPAAAAAATTFRFPSSSSCSPVSLPAPYFSAHDYPIFTPSYGDEQPSQGNHQLLTKSKTLSESWDEFGVETGSGYETPLAESKRGISYGLTNLESSHLCPEDQKSATGSCTNNITVLQSSAGKELWRNSLTDFKSVSSCNRYKPATVLTEPQNLSRSSKHSNMVVPWTDSHSSVQSQPKTRGIIARLFPKLRKKQKNESSPNRAEAEEVSQFCKDLGILSVEALKRELFEANENKEAALMQVSNMKCSLGELREKLEYLERYCEELKKALRHATTTQAHDLPCIEKLRYLPSRLNSIEGENSMPVSEEVMVEGFLQIVSEARLAVKQFCKTLIEQIDETDVSLVDNLNSLLRPYKLSLNSKYSKTVLCHTEAIINQSLYQDFENSVFQKNGSPKHLDPQQDRQAQFTSFVALRNLSWNEVLRKGTKYYSEEFSKFCDQKMSCVITTLNWTRPWPEQLLQAFFVAAKCVWLLHLLAFSFNSPLRILRVEEDRIFDSHYMEDMCMDRQKSHSPSRVKIMVMPGFHVQDRVLRCKVLCRHKTST